MQNKMCLLCQKVHAIQKLYTVASYKTPLVQRVIKEFKYRCIENIGTSLHILTMRYLHSLIISGKESPFIHSPIIIPIPLHKRRLRWRGFNQAEVLASLLGSKLRLRVLKNVVTRIRHSTPQTKLEDKKSRIINMEKMFKVNDNDELVEKHVLLIDDVCTTGATLQSCARELLNAGAKNVSAIVIARELATHTWEGRIQVEKL